jgi:gluconate kinase
MFIFGIPASIYNWAAFKLAKTTVMPKDNFNTTMKNVPFDDSDRIKWLAQRHGN